MSVPTFTVTLRPVTPIFMGGATPANVWRMKNVAKPGEKPRWERDAQLESGMAELRPASLKGLLRSWYRAIDPEYRRHEAAIFGGAGPGQGQAPFTITLRFPVRGSEAWERNRYDGPPPQGFRQRAGDLWKNGVSYVGFPLETRDTRERVERRRVALPAGGTYEVVHHLSRRALDDGRVPKALCAAWWLLCHVGGLGARCRRGFGSVTLVRWDPAEILPAGVPPLPSSARSVRTGGPRSRRA